MKKAPAPIRYTYMCIHMHDFYMHHGLTQLHINSPINLLASLKVRVCNNVHTVHVHVHVQHEVHVQFHTYGGLSSLCVAVRK